MNQQTIGSQLNDTNLTKNAKKIAEQVAKTVKESGIDWFDYVKKHPLQTMLYGVIVFYSLKGLLKNNSFRE